MELTPDRAAAAVERHGCPACGAPAGSACRTRGGKTRLARPEPFFALDPAHLSESPGGLDQRRGAVRPAGHAGRA